MPTKIISMFKSEIDYSGYYRDNISDYTVFVERLTI